MERKREKKRRARVDNRALTIGEVSNTWSVSKWRCFASATKRTTFKDASNVLTRFFWGETRVVKLEAELDYQKKNISTPSLHVNCEESICLHAFFPTALTMWQQSCTSDNIAADGMQRRKVSLLSDFSRGREDGRDYFWILRFFFLPLASYLEKRRDVHTLIWQSAWRPSI